MKNYSKYNVYCNNRTLDFTDSLTRFIREVTHVRCVLYLVRKIRNASRFPLCVICYQLSSIYFYLISDCKLQVCCVCDNLYRPMGHIDYIYIYMC